MTLEQRRRRSVLLTSQKFQDQLAMTLEQRRGAAVQKGQQDRGLLNCILTRACKTCVILLGIWALSSTILISSENLNLAATTLAATTTQRLASITAYSVDPPVGQSLLVHAPSHSIRYQEWDAMCTLKRYPPLVEKFCGDTLDRSICDLKAFKVYFKKHSAKENLIGGCPLDEAVCYAKRYPNLFQEFCHGSDTKCEYYSLRHHYEDHGKREILAWGCGIQPLQSAATTSFTTATADTTSTKEAITPLGPPLFQAVPFDSIKYHDMDAKCTLKRYSHLAGRFCDPLDRSSCDLEAFKAYFKNHSEKENLVGGCPLAEAVCYAQRYPNLFQEFCNGSASKCKYYPLRLHYEQHGMRARHAWGCDFQPLLAAAIGVSRRQPAVTINTLPVSNKYENVLGKASLQVFQGSWEPIVEFSQENSPTKNICPSLTQYTGRFCNLTAREGYQPAKYVASGLPEWSAKRFRESMKKDGGSIAFVGDSLMHQLVTEIHCLAEAENEDLSSLQYHHVLMAPLPDSIHEQFQVSRNDEDLKEAFSLQWVEKVIEDKVKYLIYNTGPWWDPVTFRERAEFCDDHDNWRKSTQEELITIYTETMEQTLLPIFTSLVKDHGVIPIWMDTPPAGNMNLTSGENIFLSQWAEYYRIFPRLNEIGRKMMVQAGGLVLPIWDASFTRSMDHTYYDNPKNVDDQLHWCGRYQGSVPLVWFQLLSQVLYGNDDEQIKATNSSITGSNNNNNPKSSLRSLQSVNVEATAAVRDQQGAARSSQGISALDQGRRSLVAENSASFVRLSRSSASPCACADAKNRPHCRANIRCTWSTESQVCSDRW